MSPVTTRCALGPRFLVPLILTLAAGSSACMNYHIIHPREAPRSVVSWAEDRISGQMKIHMEWAHPRGRGPFPSVLVHADAGHTAVEMRGVVWDLASHGYLAMAADYRRWLHGEYRRNLFAWRDREDGTAALEILRSHPMVDDTRLATLGFSQGGVFSLLIAAQAPEIKAVVAYYPVTDFETWLSAHRPNPIRRLVFSIIGAHFRRQSGVKSEQEFRELLARASPLRHAESIRAAVLLVHGERDTSASIQESRRLQARLEELGRPVKLLEIPDQGHVFNFRNEASASRAWEATLAWLERHLRGQS